MPRILLTDEQRKANLKAYQKKYREGHKEERKEYDKKYREDNKEKIKEREKEYREDNIEKIKIKNRINHWKSSGMIEPEEGWEAFAEMVENTTNCEICDVELTEGKRNSTTRCVDHSHITGQFRNVVCNSCNAGLQRGT